MGVPWSKKLSGRAEVLHFPVTNGPIMLLKPNRAGVPIYGQPRDTVVFMQPPVTPLPPPPPPQRPPVPPISVVFHNAQQTCTNTCPDGAITAPISVTVPANEYSSGVSQEAANAAALAAACAQAQALRDASPCIFQNSEVECCNNCPEGSGDPICVTTPAGTFTSSVSLAEANAAALAAACAQAAALREATPCLDPGSMVVTMDSQLREATLCGFSEFTDVSTPPKKYRRKSFTGTAANTQTVDCNGGAPIHSHQTHSGSCVYDAETCVVTSDAIYENYLGGTPETAVFVGSGPIPCGSYYSPLVCFVIETFRISGTFTGTAVCCPFFTDNLGNVSYHYATGQQTITLSEEDLEEDAIARATPVSGSPDNLAAYEPRTAFTFDYQTVAIDFDFTDLSTGQDYRVTLPLTTENYGGGSPVVTSNIYDFTAPGPTHSFSDLIVAERGKQVTVGEATLQVM